MGRMIEALRGGDLKQIPAAELQPAAVAAPEVRLIRDEPAAEPATEPMSFIEVGAPGHGFTASPDVLAVPVPMFAQVPAPAVRLAELPTTVTGSVRLKPWEETPSASHILAPELISWHQPEHSLAQQYRDLLSQMPEFAESGRVLLFTAAQSRAGTTTTLLNLAISACRQQSGPRVVVVDLNWQRPASAERLGLKPAPGLREVLDGGIALEQALQESCVQGLHAVAAGASARTLTPVTAEALRWILGWLRDRFDVVLLDAPTWSDRPELVLLLPVCDAIYPVTAANDTQPAQKTWQTIVRRGGRLRGVIQTQV